MNYTVLFLAILILPAVILAIFEWRGKKRSKIDSVGFGISRESEVDKRADRILEEIEGRQDLNQRLDQ